MNLTQLKRDAAEDASVLERDRLDRLLHLAARGDRKATRQYLRELTRLSAQKGGAR